MSFLSFGSSLLITTNMLTQDEEHSKFFHKGVKIFHMGIYSPLVEIIDEQQGYCLLKNLCPFSDRWYSVGVILENGSPHMAVDDPSVCWLNHDQADEVMRNATKRLSYNKATKDYYNTIQE